MLWFTETIYLAVNSPRRRASSQAARRSRPVTSLYHAGFGWGEQTEQKLSVFTAGDNIRVECCDSCRTYIKTIDLTKDGHAEPIVDEMASAPLDLWAQERGYVKLHPNLLGI